MGKTSLVQRFVYHRFDPRYLSTIGVNITRKDIDSLGLRFIIWDISGEAKFDTYRLSYLQGAAGALLVCDLTRPETLQTISDACEELQKIPSGLPLLLLGNKFDLLPPTHVGPQNLADFAARVSLPFRLTSAKTGEGVEDAFLDLARRIMDMPVPDENA